MGRYDTERQHAAELAERHALAVLDGNLEALEAMRFYGNMRDMYDRQMAWENRRQGASWPATPAWSN